MKYINNSIIKTLEKLPNYETTEMDPRPFDIKCIKNQVYEELNYHLKGHIASKLLIMQLIELCGNGYVTILKKKHPYDRFDIYSSIEEIISGEIKERPFNNNNSYLKDKNIFHAHHSNSSYINFNFKKHFYKIYKSDNDINRRLSQIRKRISKHENIEQILLNESLLESINKKDKSGQWIVYQRCNSKILFICLYLHDKNDINDERLYKFIRKHIKQKRKNILIILFIMLLLIILTIYGFYNF